MDKKERNKEALFSALIDLMAVKPLSRISVSELTERARVNRTSFYALYSDVDAMVRSIESDLSRSLRDALAAYELSGGSHDTATAFFTFLFGFVRDNARIFRFLLTPENNNIVIAKTCALLGDYLESTSPSQRYSQAYMAFGCIGLIQRWLSDGASESPESMAAVMVSFVEQGTGHLDPVKDPGLRPSPEIAP